VKLVFGIFYLQAQPVAGTSATSGVTSATADVTSAASDVSSATSDVTSAMTATTTLETPETTPTTTTSTSPATKDSPQSDPVRTAIPDSVSRYSGEASSSKRSREETGTSSGSLSSPEGGSSWMVPLSSGNCNR
jgi:hypothetical protein